jgi:hypothetical protein
MCSFFHRWCTIDDWQSPDVKAIVPEGINNQHIFHLQALAEKKIPNTKC